MKNMYKIEQLKTAFLQGAKFWEFHKEKATMWQSDMQLVSKEAEKRVKEGTLGFNPEDITIEAVK